jgi:hypothetical protein
MEFCVPSPSFAEMDKDVFLMYNNAITYNQTGEPVNRMAIDLFREYQEERKKLARALAEENQREKAARKQERAQKRQTKQQAAGGQGQPPPAAPT